MLVNLSDNLGNIKNWNNLQNEFYLCENFHFSFMQLVDALSRTWKKIVKANRAITNTLVLNYYLMKKNSLLLLEKLNSREINNIITYSAPQKSASETNFEQYFTKQYLDGKEIYLLPRKVTLDSYAHSFQCKIRNNVLFYLENLICQCVLSANYITKQ